MMFVGLANGFLDQRVDTPLVLEPLRRRLAQGEDSSKPATTAQAKKSVGSLRDRCKNTLHVICCVLQDRGLLRAARHVLFTCEPQTEWYNTWASELRGRQASLEFHTGLAVGFGSLTAVGEVFAWTSDATKLELAGFVVSQLSEIGLGGCTEVMVESQNDLAQRVARLQWSVFSARINSLVYNMFLLPQSFVLLVSDNPVLRAQELRRCRTLFMSFRAASQVDSPPLVALLRRSFMQWSIVKEVLDALASVAFELVPDDLHRWLTNLFSHMGGTAPVELSFQKASRAESARPDKVVDSARCLSTGVNQKVLPSLYRFPEVDPQDVREEMCSRRARLPACFFKPRHSESTMDFRGVYGRGGPAWHSPSPEGLRQMAEEAAAVCRLQSDLATIVKAWRSRLFLAGMLVWQAVPKTDKLFFSCGSCGTAVLLWPAEVHKYGSSRVWVLKSNVSRADLEWRAVTNLSHWKCIPLDYVSPAFFWRSAGGRFQEGSMPPGLCVQLKHGNGAQKDILRYHAEQAFHGFSHDLIDLVLQQELRVTYDRSKSVAEKVFLAIQAVLGCDDLAVADYLEKRAAEDTLAVEAADVLDSEEAFDALSARDAQDTEALLKSVTTSRQAAAEIRAV